MYSDLIDIFVSFLGLNLFLFMFIRMPCLIIFGIIRFINSFKKKSKKTKPVSPNIKTTTSSHASALVYNYTQKQPAIKSNSNSPIPKNNTKPYNSPINGTPKRTHTDSHLHKYVAEDCHKETGTFGEYKLYQTLKEIPGKKQILTNCYIPKSDGKTTEIDLLMIHETGIYVIESKNFSGWIFGSSDNQTWTQTFANKQKYHFYNPIWQNEGHKKHLQELLGNEIPLYSFVVFGSNCFLKNVENRTRTMVINANDFEEKIKNIAQVVPQYLNQEQINEIFLKLSSYEYATKEEKEQHINNIKTVVQNET